MQENIEFKNLEELYNRVTPALYSKAKEIRNAGYKLVTEKDIWNYLVDNSWKNKTDIELNDLVTDILYVDNYSIYDYVVNKLKKIKNNLDSNDGNVL